MADELVSGDKGAMYGDRAYESKRDGSVCGLRVSGIRSCTVAISTSGGCPTGNGDTTSSLLRCGPWWGRCLGPLSTVYRSAGYRGLAAMGVEMWFKQSQGSLLFIAWWA